jgi:hypothetical protein
MVMAADDICSFDISIISGHAQCTPDYSNIATDKKNPRSISLRALLMGILALPLSAIVEPGPARAQLGDMAGALAGAAVCLAEATVIAIAAAVDLQGLFRQIIVVSDRLVVLFDGATVVCETAQPY